MSLDFEPVDRPVVIRTTPRRRQSIGPRLVRFTMLLAVVAGSVLAICGWRALGWPRVEMHQNDDGTFREIRIVPTAKPWF